MDDVVVSGESLGIGALMRVARKGARVKITRDERVRRKVAASADFVRVAVRSGHELYGVTTSFGGMSQIRVPPEDAERFQRSAIWAHKAGAGEALPRDGIRAALLLRINSHLRGASGVRLELIERIASFLNAGATPIVPRYGSIGASGDLVPLAYITGAICGLDRSFQVEVNGKRVDAFRALRHLRLQRFTLGPKEALAMMNGTSVSTALAAICVHDVTTLLRATVVFHALALQALRGSMQSFEPFIHDQKPHDGQRRVANEMRALLKGSQLMRNELRDGYSGRQGNIIQDRYSLRCLPQFIGPVSDGLVRIRQEIEVEMNSTTDNPLIDGTARKAYHGGNFLGQYVAMGMDQIRQFLGLIGKHIDAQIALLMAPEFNGGLSASLVGNSNDPINIGLKALQLTGNSLMPLLLFYGAPIADRFPTHAEQFNQNINSQSLNAADLAHRSVSIGRLHLAIALLISVQAVDLRTYLQAGHYNASELLSPATARIYEAVRTVVGRPPTRGRPYIWNDEEQLLDAHIDAVDHHLADGGEIASAIANMAI